MSTSQTIPPGSEPIINVGYNKFIGPILKKSDAPPGVAKRFRVALQPHMLNGGGNAHGGFLMSVADIIMGYSVKEASEGQSSSTVSINCDFVAGAVGNEVLEGTTTITRKTRSLVFVSGELSAGGRTVLTATGIWKILGAP
jgi:acyl-coenzyme A thioesterase PaaI-like protein